MIARNIGVELVPCPFCHSVPICSPRVTEESMPYFVQECGTCDCAGPMGTTADHAVRLWNLRS
jgi:hypothetical protein